MADDLRGAWKETGVNLGHAFRDLGKTLVKTGKKAIKKVDEWANEDENKDSQKPEDNKD